MALPPPAPDALPARQRSTSEIRAGELSLGWAVTFALGWLGVVVGIAAVWGVSRQIGLPVWWIGPKGQPRPIVVSLAVFAPAVWLIAGTTARVRHLPRWGLLGAAVLATVALVDLRGPTGLAIVQLAIAAAGALVSVAAWSGTYQPTSPSSR